MAHTIDDTTLPYDPATTTAKVEIPAEQFFDLDLRVGVVTAAEDFPEARKPAYKITVDFGPHVGTLQSSAQITHYSTDELVGRRVVGAVNIGSRKIAGFTSQFLVLGGLEASGVVRLLSPDVPGGQAPLAPGSVVA